MTSSRFSIFPRFDDQYRTFAGLKTRIHHLPSELFPSDDFGDRLARSLALHRVVHIKEFLEAFEFYARVRRRIRRPTMVDLCAGHGLVGILFAACEPSVQRVILVDSVMPPTHHRVLNACAEVAPWIRDKVTYWPFELTSHELVQRLPTHAGHCLVHACGELTDRGLDLALTTRAVTAAMPCCYGKADKAKVPGVSRELGRATAIDVSRSYRLAEAGYQVDWAHIPTAITPRNRILIGWNRRPSAE